MRRRDDPRSNDAAPGAGRRTGLTRRAYLRSGTGVLSAVVLSSALVDWSRSNRAGPTPDPGSRPTGTGDPGSAGGRYAAASAADLTFDVQRSYDAVRDLGWDPTGRDPVDVPLESHTEVLVPPGRYLLDRDFRNDDLRHFRLRGTGASHDDATFVTDGEHRWLCRVVDTGSGRPPSHVEVGNVHLAYGPGRDTAGPGLHLALDDGLSVHDVEWTGYVPRERHDDFKCYVLVTGADGVGFLDRLVATGPSHVGGHRDGKGMGIVSARHRGTLYFRDLRVENMPGDAPWYTSGYGRCVFERCLFRNNAMANLRVGGDSVVRDCVLVQDHDAMPAYGGEFHAANGLYVAGQAGGAAGTLVEGCDVVMASLDCRDGQAVRMDPSTGDVTVRETRIRVDAGGPAVVADPYGDGVGPYRRPEDAAWRFESCSVHGSRPVEWVFGMQDRPGSSVVRTSVDIPAERVVRDRRTVRYEPVPAGSGYRRARPRDPRAVVFGGPAAEAGRGR
jgi:hypothetical protein